MICRFCGMEFDDSLSVCPTCGGKVGDTDGIREGKLTWGDSARASAGKTFDDPGQNSGEEAPREQSDPNDSGAYTQNPGYRYGGMPFVAGPTMRWHTFLVYFAVWAMSLGNLSNGLLSLVSALGKGTHNVFSTAAVQRFLSGDFSFSIEDFYVLFPAMKTIDVIYGFIAVTAAALGVVSGVFLFKMKKNGPKLFIAFLSLYFALTLFYSIASTYVISLSSLENTASLRASMTSSGIVTAAVYAGLVFANYVYYKKRKHLFVN